MFKSQNAVILPTPSQQTYLHKSLVMGVAHLMLWGMIQVLSPLLIEVDNVNVINN